MRRCCPPRYSCAFCACSWAFSSALAPSFLCGRSAFLAASGAFFLCRWGFKCCHQCMKNAYCVPVTPGGALEAGAPAEAGGTEGRRDGGTGLTRFLRAAARPSGPKSLGQMDRISPPTRRKKSKTNKPTKLPRPPPPPKKKKRERKNTQKTQKKGRKAVGRWFGSY